MTEALRSMDGGAPIVRRASSAHGWGHASRRALSKRGALNDGVLHATTVVSAPRDRSRHLRAVAGCRLRNSSSPISAVDCNCTCEADRGRSEVGNNKSPCHCRTNPFREVDIAPLSLPTGLLRTDKQKKQRTSTATATRLEIYTLSEVETVVGDGNEWIPAVVPALRAMINMPPEQETITLDPGSQRVTTSRCASRQSDASDEVKQFLVNDQINKSKEPRRSSSRAGSSLRPGSRASSSLHPWQHCLSAGGYDAPTAFTSRPQTGVRWHAHPLVRSHSVGSFSNASLKRSLSSSSLSGILPVREGLETPPCAPDAFEQHAHLVACLAPVRPTVRARVERSH